MIIDVMRALHMCVIDPIYGKSCCLSLPVELMLGPRFGLTGTSLYSLSLASQYLHLNSAHSSNIFYLAHGVIFTVLLAVYAVYFYATHHVYLRYA